MDICVLYTVFHDIFSTGCFILSPVSACWSPPPNAVASILTTRHNLSVTGPGEIKALTESRVCIFCHTPHNAAPGTPLWNKEIKPVNYILYDPQISSTLMARPSQPTGASRLCLSCHDGTLALGTLLRPAEALPFVSEQYIAPGRRSYLGTNISGDHPISFNYYGSISNPYAGLARILPTSLILYGPGNLECSTCHDAHEDKYLSPDKTGRLTGKFLAIDNRYSGLCVACHSDMGGWNMTTCGRSQKLVNGVLPLLDQFPLQSWPTWLAVDEWGCESCHTPHAAGGRARLLHYQKEEDNCYLCHDGTVASKNIKERFSQPSRHNVELTIGVHDPTESPVEIRDHVECVDCHNPHAQNGTTAVAPYVSGRLAMVAGVEDNGLTPTYPLFAQKEYQICFKCHAGSNSPFPFIQRVINEPNKAFQFAFLNPSYHPVVATGKNPNIPSLNPPNTDPADPPPPGLTSLSMIYCYDCHSDDAGGSQGPHGSSIAPILRNNYKTTFGPSSDNDFELCYRCHNKNSIRSDASFQKKVISKLNGGGHSGHLAAGAPCSACHDAHGVNDNKVSGTHTNLINFDITMATPNNGDPLFPNTPVFIATGLNSGKCSLVCHGVLHDNLSYP